MDQHICDLIVTDITVSSTDVTGLTHVKAGRQLISSGRLYGGLKIEASANAIVSGVVGSDIHNDGNLVLNGKVLGKLLGSGLVVKGDGASVAGEDRSIDL